MKNNFTGMGDIFKFAFVQTVKSKVFVIMQVILCAVALLAPILITAFSGADDEETEEVTLSERIESISIHDFFMEGKLAEALMNELKNSEEYKHSTITVLDSSKSVDETMEHIKQSDKGEVYVVIEYSNDVNDVYYGFNYSVYYGEKTKELDEAANELSMYIDGLHEKMLASILVDNEIVSDYIASDFSYEISLIGVDNNIVKDEGALAMGEYWLTYAFLMLAIFTISIGGSKVAEQLVTEKSTKVIEYIMTSVKPMALITGKVFASVASIIYVISTMLICFIISIFASSTLFQGEDGSVAILDIIKSFLESDIMAGTTPIHVAIAILIFIFGTIFYGFVGGIAGATVSKVEEMAEGVKLFTFTMIIGAYVPMFIMMMSSMDGGDWGIVNDIVYILPITSVFIVPAYILIGKISLMTGLISLAVMIVAVLLMFIIVSKIFEYLIYYNGTPLKLKDLIRIYKDKRRAK